MVFVHRMHIWACTGCHSSGYYYNLGYYFTVKYAQKIAQNAFGIFPKFLPVMLFILPIMLVLCFNMNNIDVRILLLECSIRVFMI